MVLYDLAFFADKLGAEKPAAEYRRLARKNSPDYVFPFQPEAVEVLRSAIRRRSRATRGHRIIWATYFSTGSPMRL